jgi:hypothetical protein
MGRHIAPMVCPTCFCRTVEDHDLALTELINGQDHQFLVEVGSAIGSAMLAE